MKNPTFALKLALKRHTFLTVKCQNYYYSCISVHKLNKKPLRTALLQPRDLVQ